MTSQWIDPRDKIETLFAVQASPAGGGARGVGNAAGGRIVSGGRRTVLSTTRVCGRSVRRRVFRGLVRSAGR